MHPTYLAIYGRAFTLRMLGWTQPAADLARDLRWLGLTAPSTGAPYTPGRGIYSSLAATYRAVLNAHGAAEAAKVAESFTDRHGRLPWA